MRVLVQWAQKNPGDWEKVDPADWASLPSRPVPGSGELGGNDNRKGWITHVDVQGVLFGDDHVVVEPLTIAGEDAVRVTGWNDDPDDWPVGERWAHVWTFLPLAPDPALGNAINTRQSQVVYAEGARFARLEMDPPQNTSVRPWSEFVPPPNPRHGVLMEDAKYAEHVAARRMEGWRHWSDHLPESETIVDELGRRRLKVQRDLGRWHRASRTITYIQRDTDRAEGWSTSATTHENALELTTATAATESITVDGGAGWWSFSSPSNEPNSADWPSGTYHAQLDCTAASAGLTYGVWIQNSSTFVEQGFWRVSSDLLSGLEALGGTADEFSGTGLKLHTSTGLDFSAGDAADRFATGVGVTGAMHGNAITLEFNTSDSYADGPWSTGTSITVPTGSLTLTGFAPAVNVTVSVEVPTGSLTLTGLVPTVTASDHQTVDIPAASLSLTGLAPTVSVSDNQQVDVPAASLALTGLAPTATATVRITIPTASLALTGLAPTVNVSVSVDVPAGSLALTGLTPTVTASDHQSVTVPTGSLTLTGLAPAVTVSDNQRVDVPVASLALTGLAPTVAATANVEVAVPAASLALTGAAPTVTASDHQSVEVPVGGLTLTGFAPTITTDASVTVEVPTASLALTGSAPTVTATADVSIAVPVASLTLSGLAPTVTTGADVSVEVPTGSLALTGLAPTVTATANVSVEVPTAALTLTGASPTVTVSVHVEVIVPTGSLTLTASAPAVTASDHQTVEVPVASLTLVAFAPTVATAMFVTIFATRNARHAPVAATTAYHRPLAGLEARHVPILVTTAYDRPTAGNDARHAPVAQKEARHG